MRYIFLFTFFTFHFAEAQIPDTIVTPQQADSLIIHYWDNYQLSTINYQLTEQAFVDYLTILPLSPENAFVNIPKHEIIVSLADKYLNDKDSPLYNPDQYTQFVHQYLDNKLPDIVLKHDDQLIMLSELLDYQLSTANYQLSTITLIFYDPECDDCLTLIHQLIEAQTENVIAINMNPQSHGSEDSIFAKSQSSTQLVHSSTCDIVTSSWLFCSAVDTNISKQYPIRRLPFLYTVQK